MELSLSDSLVDLVKEGFDIGIRGGREPPPGMVARRLGKVSTVLVASRAYLQRHGLPQDWTELSQHRRIGLRLTGTEAAPWMFRTGARLQSFDEVPALVLSAPDAVADAARQHLGIAQLAFHHVQRDLRDGTLVRVLEHQHVARSIDLSIFYPHRRGMARRVQTVVDALVRGLAGAHAPA